MRVRLGPRLQLYILEGVMSKVTAIQFAKGRAKIFLDDMAALNLDAEVVMKEGLRTGQELLASRIKALASSDHLQRCLNAAIRYLSYRPRSELEVRERLKRRGFNGDGIEVVIANLKERGLINDMDFARFWKENRGSFRPCSQWLVRLELKQKGVAEDIIDQVVNTIDNEDSAHRAALSKARSLPQSDYQDFRRRLGGYLKRRGFGYEVANYTVERVWRELRANTNLH
jgi:regulatory protein